MRIRNKATGLHEVVPCSKCPKCRERRANDWIIRLQAEERRHASSAFVTLTYAPEYCPLSPGLKLMTLDKADFQKFMKRLRKNTGIKTIKYYAVGEYGSTTMRPHYHAIMFDVTFDQVYDAWGLGECHIGTVSGESIAYTCKYICKPKAVPAFAKDDRTPEFSLMSKNLGINYLSDEIVNYHVTTGNSYYTSEGGYKKALPRYYRDRIFNEEQKQGMNAAASLEKRKNLEAAIRKAGGSEQYHHMRFEGIHAAMKNFNKKDINRDKI